MANHGCVTMTLKLKPNHPNGNGFVTIEEIKEKLKQKLLAISKTAFQKCFEDWEKLWQKCIISEGVTLKGTI